VSSGLISTLNATLLVITTGAAVIDSSNQNAPYISQGLVEPMVDEAMEGVDLQIGKPSKQQSHLPHRTGNAKQIRVKYDHVRAYNSIMADYLGPIPIFKGLKEYSGSPKIELSSSSQILPSTIHFGLKRMMLQVNHLFLLM